MVVGIVRMHALLICRIQIRRSRSLALTSEETRLHAKIETSPFECYRMHLSNRLDERNMIMLTIVSTFWVKYYRPKNYIREIGTAFLWPILTSMLTISKVPEQRFYFA